MYIDETIVASLLVIGGTLVFLGGFATIAYKDFKKDQAKHAKV